MSENKGQQIRRLSSRVDVDAKLWIILNPHLPFLRSALPLLLASWNKLKGPVKQSIFKCIGKIMCRNSLTQWFSRYLSYIGVNDLFLHEPTGCSSFPNNVGTCHEHSWAMNLILVLLNLEQKKAPNVAGELWSFFASSVNCDQKMGGSQGSKQLQHKGDLFRLVESQKPVLRMPDFACLWRRGSSARNRLERMWIWLVGGLGFAIWKMCVKFVLPYSRDQTERRTQHIPWCAQRSISDGNKLKHQRGKETTAT